MGAAVSALSGQCMDLGVVSFGCSKEAVQESIQDIRTRIQQSIKADADANVNMKDIFVQKVRVKNGPHGEILGNQVGTLIVNAKVTYITDINQKVVASAASAIDQRIEDKFNQLSEVKRGILTSITNQKDLQIIKKSIQTDVKQALTVGAMANIVQTRLIDQDLEVINEGKVHGDQIGNATAYMDAFSQNVIAQSVEGVLKNEYIQMIIAAVDQSTSQGPSLGMEIILIVGGVLLLYWVYTRFFQTQERGYGGYGGGGGGSGGGSGTTTYIEERVLAPIAAQPAAAAAVAIAPVVRRPAAAVAIAPVVRQPAAVAIAPVVRGPAAVAVDRYALRAPYAKSSSSPTRRRRKSPFSSPSSRRRRRSRPRAP